MISAVLKIKGRQYWVKEGEEILVDRLNKEENIKPQVLLFADDNKLSVGKPFVEGVRVKLEVLGEVKGNRLKVLKYKAKSRYRKRIGFRPLFTKIKVSEISS